MRQIPKESLLPADIDAEPLVDRKSTRLNSSHSQISYAVFCLKKKLAASKPGCSEPCSCTRSRSTYSAILRTSSGDSSMNTPTILGRAKSSSTLALASSREAQRSESQK